MKIYRAEVIDNKDPDQLGRVKVKFNFLGEKAKDTPSVWARVVRPISHKGSGSWFLPDVGDEVVVAFENDRIDVPIILGSVYGENTEPPKSGLAGDLNADGENNLLFTKSKSGHQIVFNDKSGSESLEVTDAKSNKVTMNKAGITIENASGDLIEIKKSEITIKSSGSVTIAGSSEVKLGEGASEALVKGQAFMQLFNSHTHTGNLGSPTSPAMVPMTPAQLSQKVKTE